MSTKRFPEEFKREAASLVLDQGYSLAEASRSLDVDVDVDVDVEGQSHQKWQHDPEDELVHGVSPGIKSPAYSEALGWVGVTGCQSFGCAITS